jgi:hypothetical protein
MPNLRLATALLFAACSALPAHAADGVAKNPAEAL